jgi:hypothetical protein
MYSRRGRRWKCFLGFGRGKTVRYKIGVPVEFPGFNSFHRLAYEVIGLLYRESPLTIEEIHWRFMKHGGPRAVQLDFRTQVPLAFSHLEKVLNEHLNGHVALYANGWKSFGPPLPLQPIWKMYDYPWGSMGYRMGEGEYYWADWKNWYRQLDANAQEQYRQQHPEPEDWRHFYEYVGLQSGRDDANRAILHDKIEAARLEYTQTEFERAVACEKNGQKVEALFHYDRATIRFGHSKFDEALAARTRLVAEIGWIFEG